VVSALAITVATPQLGTLKPRDRSVTTRADECVRLRIVVARSVTPARICRAIRRRGERRQQEVRSGDRATGTKQTNVSFRP
jgi:hypothetical protein